MLLRGDRLGDRLGGVGGFPSAWWGVPVVRPSPRGRQEGSALSPTLVPPPPSLLLVVLSPSPFLLPSFSCSSPLCAESSCPLPLGTLPLSHFPHPCLLPLQLTLLLSSVPFLHFFPSSKVVGRRPTEGRQLLWRYRGEGSLSIGPGKAGPLKKDGPIMCSCVCTALGACLLLYSSPGSKKCPESIASSEEHLSPITRHLSPVTSHESPVLSFEGPCTLPAARLGGSAE